MPTKAQLEVQFHETVEKYTNAVNEVCRLETQNKRHIDSLKQTENELLDLRAKRRELEHRVAELERNYRYAQDEKEMYERRTNEAMEFIRSIIAIDHPGESISGDISERDHSSLRVLKYIAKRLVGEY